MDFIIKYSLEKVLDINVEFVLEDFADVPELNVLYINKLSHLDYHDFKQESKRAILCGDVIGKPLLDSLSITKRGFFYRFVIDENKKSIEIMPDFHCMLPVYYSEQGNLATVSSSYNLLVKELKNINKTDSLYAEIAVLYTSLGDSTYIKEIKRLTYGKSIILSNTKIQTVQNYRFFDNFAEIPQKFKSAIHNVTDCFIDISKDYFEPLNAISLTGGFDGRTITGCAHYHKAEFINFSYGKIGSPDVDVPISLSHELGLKYSLIELDREYLSDLHLQCMREYLLNTGGLNGFLYPQSIFYVKKLGRFWNNIVTGYMGSEVLRSTREPDCEIISPAVFDILLNGITQSNWAYTRGDHFKELELIGSIQEVTDVLNKILQYFMDLPQGLSLNQKFVSYAYENLYRNTFGPWIYNGMHYSKIRAPFLDYDFFKSISTTEVSQFYKPFPETKLSKRMRSLVFYAVVLDKTWPELGKLPISKGYSPIDLISATGKLNILLNYSKAKKKNDIHGLDKLNSVSGANQYLNSLKNIDRINPSLIERIKNLMLHDAYSRTYSFLALSKLEYNLLLEKR